MVPISSPEVSLELETWTLCNFGVIFGLFNAIFEPFGLTTPESRYAQAPNVAQNLNFLKKSLKNHLSFPQIAYGTDIIPWVLAGVGNV